MNRYVLPVFLTMACFPLHAQPAVDKQIDVFGQKIHYLEAGSGPAVILLHGLGGDATNWGQNVPALAAKYHVFVPDQIGFGQSDKPFINYRVETLVDFLDAFCRKLEISKAAVVGNSLGGWAAMAFTLAHPDKVSRLVLVDSAGYSMEKQGRKPNRDEMLALNFFHRPADQAGPKLDSGAQGNGHRRVGCAILRRSSEEERRLHH